VVETAAPVRIQRLRVQGAKMEGPDGRRAKYCGRPGRFGNPYQLGTREGLVREPAADLVTPWEYEGRCSADGAQHDMVWPGGEVTKHHIRYMTREESIATFRRALIAPTKGMRLFHRATRDQIDVGVVRRELAGQHLACWCKVGDPCHVDVLLWVANAPLDEVKEAAEKEYEIIRAMAERVAALHPEILAGRVETRELAGDR
jgi:hypothetical protein